MRGVELAVRGRRVVTAGGVVPRTVLVAGGVIVAVDETPDVPAGVPVVDAGDAVVAPGIVDTHVHVNEPGRTDWEGFASATRAAAAGGVTTILDMPLNCVPPTTTVEALEAKRAAARRECVVDVGFWGGAVPGNLGDLAALHEAGVFGFKAFLVHPGVDEFRSLSVGELGEAMRALARLPALLLVHAELPGPIDEATAALRRRADDPARYRTYLASRPPAAEDEAVAAVLAAARATGCRVHVLHLSSAGALGAIEAARAAAVPVSVETCPHYLALAADEVADGATAFKCAPPIREAANREQLWQGLRGGVVDAVVSDHSPSPPALKEGDFLSAWGGIASLQLGLPVVWTAARGRGFGPADLAGWMSAGPARVAGLARKGAVAPGFDADLVLWHPDEAFTVDAAALEHRHHVTPYAGRRLHGAVQATYLRGVEVWRDGKVVAEGHGRLLTRGAA